MTIETQTGPTDMTVSRTILEQLGGRRFLVMTGAKNLVGSADALTMRIASVNKDRKRVNVVSITLDPSDTYTVEAIFASRNTRTVVGTRSNVYCDGLQAVFTELTGLYTHL
jgi:hypothetical protein